MRDLTGKKIAILATHGFERSELVEPKEKLAGGGAEVRVLSPEQGEIRAWNHTEWADTVPVDRAVASADVGDYDALVVPGGQINPDLLRTDERAVAFVRAFVETGKPVAAICHGPWMHVEAGVLDGRRATSYHSIRTDVMNAGAEWSDQEVVVDGNLITSRKPDDLPGFIEKVAEMTAQR